MSNFFQKLLGTTESSFVLQGRGARLKNNSGNLDVRNYADSAYADINAATLKANTAVQTDTINELSTDAGVTIDSVLIKDGEVDGVDVSVLNSNAILKGGSVAFTADQSLGGNKLTNVGAPTTGTDAANKTYVDNAIQGISAKSAVRAATTDNLDVTASGSGLGKTLTATANGAISIDGVSLASGERVLVKDQTTGADNGIYTVTTVGDAGTAFVLTRAVDFDGTPSNEVEGGDYCWVQEGTVNGDNGFVLISDEPLTVDTSALNFSQFNGAGQVTAGDGLSKSGNEMSVNVDDSTIEINADTLRIKDSGVTTAKIADDNVTKEKIAADVAGNGLGQNVDGSLEVNVDDSTVEVSGDTLQVKAGGIDTTQLANDSVDKDKIAADVAGNGLGQNVDGSLEVNVDDSTVEISTDTLQIKAGGIDTTQLANDSVDKDKIAADVAGNGLGQNVDGSLEVNVDDSTVEVSGDSLQVKAGGISNSHINASAAIAWTKIDKTGSSLTDLATHSFNDLDDIPTQIDFNTNLSAESANDDADMILIYDDSAGVYKKQSRANFLSGIASENGISKSVEITLGTDATYDSTTSIPANARVESVMLAIDSAYDNSATIKVDVNGSTPLEIMGTGDNFTDEADSLFMDEPYATVSSSNAGVLRATIANSPTTGSATLIVKYTEQYLA